MIVALWVIVFVECKMLLIFFVNGQTLNQRLYDVVERNDIMEVTAWLERGADVNTRGGSFLLLFYPFVRVRVCIRWVSVEMKWCASPWIGFSHDFDISVSERQQRNVWFSFDKGSWCKSYSLCESLSLSSVVRSVQPKVSMNRHWMNSCFLLLQKVTLRKQQPG